MTAKRLPPAEVLMALVRDQAAIARRVATKIAREQGEPDAFSQGAACALELLLDSLEEPDDAEEIAAAEAAPDH